MQTVTTQIKDFSGPRSVTVTLFDCARLPKLVGNSLRASTRGCYQESLVAGNEAWSGAGLSGTARDWSASYAASRTNLLARIAGNLARDGWEAGVPLVLMDSRWTRMLVLTSPRGRQYLWD